MGLPVKREIAIEVPAPAEDTTWWPIERPAPPAREPAAEPTPATSKGGR